MKDLSLSGMLVGDSLKSTKFGILATTVLRRKYIPQRELTFALFSATVLRLITLLKTGVGGPSSGENRVMDFLNGLAFLTF